MRISAIGLGPKRPPGPSAKRRDWGVVVHSEAAGWQAVAEGIPQAEAEALAETLRLDGEYGDSPLAVDYGTLQAMRTPAASPRDRSSAPSR